MHDIYDWPHFIIQSLPDGIITVDGQLLVTDLNRAGEKLTGITRGQALGQHCGAVLRSSLCGQECPLKTAMNSGEVVSREAVLKNRRGQEIEVMLAAAAMASRRLGGHYARGKGLHPLSPKLLKGEEDDMGLKETMTAIAAKPLHELTYADVSDAYLYHIRIDFDPVGIRFCLDEAEIAQYRLNAKAKAKLTYCQYLAMARSGRKAMFMKPEQLLCENAEPIFGFRELDQEKDTKRHMKYLRDEKLAWQAPLTKAKLPLGDCRGIYMAPLDVFDQTGLDPHIVFFMALPYQVYHILNDYMGGMGKSSLPFNHTPNSAVCSGSVWAYNHNTANMTTMCAGSKTSGKSDMSMMNLFIPGEHIKPSAGRLLARAAEMGGPSVLGKGGQPWPGLDVCKGCPLFKYEEV